jgi:hypothetical protein
MKIEYYHASRYGNGATVADEFKQQMSTKGVTVSVQHVREVKPDQIPRADLYVFSSPGRFGKPIGDMDHFLKKAKLPSGSKYAIMVTELCPKPEEVEERIPVDEKAGKCQRVISSINQLLQKKGLVNVAEGKIFVTGMKGPLENNWQKQVEILCAKILVLPLPVLEGVSTQCEAVSAV